ncbi:acyltransferase family protein [Sphingomonas xanthus]|uniref:Acyltransferase n=1 Tax=Sphingomonas xanthus TaxID=2594473 RepID=A0A516IU54_9SPHN|nr:acyltransferase family protein [Sphingomonas xanthus]QDP20437.1 acyltransferase [Sphingomonas xanthus]
MARDDQNINALHTKSIIYRPEIDGLRALAVLPVMIYHAGISGITGGYVGVDVFFVISGYLITSILIAEVDKGKFNIATFYERRAKRILPALCLVSFLTTPVAILILSPSDLIDFGNSLISIATFSSNIFFWLEANYFEENVDLKPMLHTWSLSVEEQFYIVFPFFILLLRRLLKSHTCKLFMIAAALSFALSLVTYRAHASATFYLLPTRGWELLMGAVLAVPASNYNAAAGKAAVKNWLAIAGLSAILIPAFVYDKNTPFPGPYAIAPVVGTMLIIKYATPGTIVYRLLTVRPMIAIGLISYSAYLWHQPIISLFRYAKVEALFLWEQIALIFISLGMAFATWRFVEQPLRAARVTSKRSIFAWSAVALAAVAATGAILVQLKGMPARFGSNELGWATLEHSDEARTCLDKAEQCNLGSSKGPPNFAVIGDSHAWALFDALDDVASRYGLQGRFLASSACPPLLNVHLIKASPAKSRACKRVHDQIVPMLEQSPSIGTVFLVGRWQSAVAQNYDFRAWGLRTDAPADLPSSRAAFRAGVRHTAQELNAMGVRVVFVKQVPQQRELLEPLLARSWAALPWADREHSLSNGSVLVREHIERQREANAILLEGADFGADYYDPASVMCNNFRCPVAAGSSSFYSDDDHLSPAGAAKLAYGLVALIRPHRRPPQ